MPTPSDMLAARRRVVVLLTGRNVATEVILGVQREGRTS